MTTFRLNRKINFFYFRLYILVIYAVKVNDFFMKLHQVVLGKTLWIEFLFFISYFGKIYLDCLCVRRNEGLLELIDVLKKIILLDRLC